MADRSEGSQRAAAPASVAAAEHGAAVVVVNTAAGIADERQRRKAYVASNAGSGPGIDGMSDGPFDGLGSEGIFVAGAGE